MDDRFDQQAQAFCEKYVEGPAQDGAVIASELAGMFRDNATDKCIINPWLSRSCERGTKSCSVVHAAAKAPPGPLSSHPGEELLKPWSGDTPLGTEGMPKNTGKIDWLIQYLLTVRRRFGNTCVTFEDIRWGASALWELDRREKQAAEAARAKGCDAE